MTADYVLDLGGPMTPHAVRDVLARTAVADGLAASGVRFEPPGAVLRSGVLVAVGDRRPLPYPHPVEEAFGFTPSAGVLFRPARDTDPEVQVLDMVRLTVALLDALPGDAYLAFEGEITYLVRRAGELTITPDDDFWRPEVAALLPPHHRAPLPNL
jgi:hypothetical protein